MSGRVDGGFNWECSNCPCFPNTNFNYKVKMKLKLTVDTILRWKLYIVEVKLIRVSGETGHSDPIM